MEQEKKEKQAGKAVEASTEAKSSQSKTPNSLKSRSKITKKPKFNALQTKKGKVTALPVHRFRNKKNKNSLDERNKSNDIKEEGSKKQKLNSKKGNLKQKQNLSKQKDSNTSRQTQKVQDGMDGLNKNGQRQKDEEKIPSSDKSLINQKDGEKQSAAGKSSNQKEGEKQSAAGKSQEKEMKKEKLGGLIFMCSKKTKPDCFHYRVMGVQGGKKDLVLGIKPGLKLFLYDFDLKLMYGIFKASSAGGMKLEPKAFGGAFPAQVRFDIHKDCLPLPESVFKKAIKENYNEKNKFKIELTPKQVRKLSELFRPVDIHSTALPVRTAPMPIVEDRNLYAGLRESNQEKFARDPYANASSRSFNRLSPERDERVAYGRRSSLSDEVPRDLYMTEKEYRAYGLQADRKNWNLIPSPLDPYQRGHEIGQPHVLRHPDPIYGDTIPIARGPVPNGPLCLSEREYQSYGVGSRHELPSRVSPLSTTLDSYTRASYTAYSYGASSVDPYLALSRREDIGSGSYAIAGLGENYLVGADPLRRGETDRAALHSSLATSSLSNNHQHQFEGPKPELAVAPVSSKYSFSFAGPPLSHR